jgi:hypothetical protein
LTAAAWSRALFRIGEAGLDRRGGSQEWTPRQIVHHLADSEMTSAIRLRRLIAEDHPEIMGYDEPEYARRLYYDRPIGPTHDAVKAARATTATILDRLTEEEWQREGTHSESGRYTVEGWLQITPPTRTITPSRCCGPRAGVVCSVRVLPCRPARTRPCDFNRRADVCAHAARRTPAPRRRAGRGGDDDGRHPVVAAVRRDGTDTAGGSAAGAAPLGAAPALDAPAAPVSKRRRGRW